MSRSRRLSSRSPCVWLRHCLSASAALLCPSAAADPHHHTKKTTPARPATTAHARSANALPTHSQHFPNAAPTLSQRSFLPNRCATPQSLLLVTRCSLSSPPLSATRNTQHATRNIPALSNRALGRYSPDCPHSHHGPGSCVHIAQLYRPSGEPPCSQSP
jgi:hypothetical protein